MGLGTKYRALIADSSGEEITDFMELKYKVLAGLQIAKAKILKKKIPVFLSWAATYRCNQRCLYCKMPELANNEMTTQQAKLMIDKMFALGTRIVNITGGEALLREDIFELIDYFKKKGVYVCLNSNGVLVQDNLQRLKAVNLLNLSVEGSAEVHDTIRGKGAYQAVIHAAQTALSLGIKVSFTATINKYNSHCLDYIINLADKLKIKVGFEILEHYMLGSLEENPLSIDFNQVRTVLGVLISYKKKRRYSKTIANSLRVLKYLSSWPKLEPLNCASGNIVFRITPDGIMFPCAKSSYEKLSRSKYSINLLTQQTEEIKAELDAWIYPKHDCLCSCSSRHAASLAWNLKV